MATAAKEKLAVFRFGLLLLFSFHSFSFLCVSVLFFLLVHSFRKISILLACSCFHCSFACSYLSFVSCTKTMKNDERLSSEKLSFFLVHLSRQLLLMISSIHKVDDIRAML